MFSVLVVVICETSLVEREFNIIILWEEDRAMECGDGQYRRGSPCTVLLLLLLLLFDFHQGSRENVIDIPPPLDLPSGGLHKTPFAYFAFSTSFFFFSVLFYFFVCLFVSFCVFFLFLKSYLSLITFLIFSNWTKEDVSFYLFIFIFSFFFIVHFIYIIISFIILVFINKILKCKKIIV